MQLLLLLTRAGTRCTCVRAVRRRRARTRERAVHEPWQKLERAFVRHGHGHVIASLPSVGQQLLQLCASVEHSCLDRIDWARGDRGDFLVRAAVEIGELHDCAMLRGQVPQGHVEQVA